LNPVNGSMNTSLPQPSADAQAASNALVQRIAAEIRAGGSDGWLSFARYMGLALYTPGLGYYAGGSRKFGAEGDFLTAPELTPLFGQALARQVAQVMKASAAVVLEAGAGSGKLAADLLLALDALGCAPEHYQILELSGELQARQRETIQQNVPALFNRVEWLDTLPEKFSGCLIGNELLDAMPTHEIVWCEDGIKEVGVSLDNEGRFVYAERDADAHLAALAKALDVAAPYRSEIGLACRSWVSEMTRRLHCGALLLIDYGLPRHEYYHPQRNGGTIRCHYRQRTHDDPFWWPGLSDITAHIDFTAVAEAGHEAGADVAGYTSQSAFLMNCGIGELFAQRQNDDNAASAARASGALNLLLSPNEMGELFKVIALTKRINEPLLGFARSDKTHTL
jgi:SAM-dependent MidA family methyltransferase